MTAQEAELEFENRVQALFEQRVVSRHPNIPFQLFHSRLRSLCRRYLRKNPTAQP